MYRPKPLHIEELKPSKRGKKKSRKVAAKPITTTTFVQAFANLDPQKAAAILAAMKNKLDNEKP